MEGLALTQGIHEVFQLVDKQLWRPEFRALAGQQGGIAASELVVVDDRSPIEAQQLVGVDIVVRGAGAAMQDEDGRLACSSSRQ